MTPVVAKAAATLIDAGPTMTTAIAALEWTIVLARLAVAGLELWERYLERARESGE